MRRWVVLAVDHNPRNQQLLQQLLGREGYEVRGATSLEQFAQALAGAEEVNLALVDISGFDRRIWDYCERLRDRAIPFLVLSPRHAAALEQESVTHGARGVLVKPLAVKEVLGLVKTLLEEEG